MGFDKYRADEDMDGYNEQEQYEGMTIFDSESGVFQRTRELGENTADEEFKQRISAAKAKLTKTEAKVFDMMLQGRPTSFIVKRLKLPKRWIEKCRQNIREKLG